MPPIASADATRVDPSSETDSISFAELGVPQPMALALAKRGIAAPFPIQATTIPDALDGRDICGRAPTGSGKTIAFGIPLVLGIERARPRRPRGLVLVPTRELAAQVCHELQLLSKPKGPWVEPFYGGVGFHKQLAALKRGVDIAVACPGRLADLINQEQCSLRDVDFVVIDEADRMADMGFLPEVRRLLDQCSSDRQTLLFSATLDGDVDVLISRYQTNPVRHEHIGDEEDASRATHLFWSVERSNRAGVTAKIVADHGPTVVFCRTKRGADRLARQLDQFGLEAAAIHGDRSQAQRERALKSFHQGRVAALVATDVAARGIHVDNVACVVHYDPPGEAKDYVHRSGRTARAGASGVVVSLVPNELRGEVKKLQRALGYPIGLTKPEEGNGPRSHKPSSQSSKNRPADRAIPPSIATVATVATIADEARPQDRSGGKARPSGASRRKAKRSTEMRSGESRPSDPGNRDSGNRDSGNESGDGSQRPSRPGGPGRNGKSGRKRHVHDGPRVRTKSGSGPKQKTGPGTKSGPKNGAAKNRARNSAPAR